MKSVDRDRWGRIESLLDGALELPPAERSVYLGEKCAGDPELRAEVEALLAADSEADGFLGAPAVEYAAGLLDELSTAHVARGAGHFGPYELVRRIGVGGMGEVFEARDTRLQRRVALKLLPAVTCRNPEAKARFLREARAAAALDHPNICTVHDIGESGGGPAGPRLYIVMAHYDGETLQQKIERGPLPIDEAVDLAAQVARGLEHAHAAGIVHRDVKPANVMVTGDRGSPGRAKILDFGIARIAGEAGLTSTGSSPGTPNYMSPEQARGEPTDERTDVWSLGVMLYEMLTGRRPFAGRSPLAVIHEIVGRDPEPLERLRPEVPAALARTVERMLAKDPGARHAGVREVLAELEALGALAEPETTAIRTLLLIEPVDGGDTLPDRPARDLLASHDGLALGAFLLFERPIDAVSYALAHVRDLASSPAPRAVHAALHLGEVRLRGSVPLRVEESARPVASHLLALAGRCQILMTRGAFDLARQAVAEDRPLDAKVRWKAHGPYLFADLDDPVGVFEVGVEGFAPLVAPPESEVARRAVQGDGAEVLGWRPAAGQPLPERPHWILGEKLGAGGFGEVWLARHPKTGERRVFKFCYERELLKSLQREVTFFRLMKEALGTRDDIVRILDWNFEEPPFYVESEYTEGGDLVEWAKAQGGLAAVPLPTRLELVAEVAEALAAAHSVGILHKDVKPANVLITSDHEGRPRARLTDFGVGMLTDPSVLSGSGITMLGLTQAEPTASAGHTSAGTRLYQAPEILEGKVPTVQADLYALGVMLYQMIVGDFSRALARGWQRDVADEILREDVACFVDGAPERRPGNAGEIADRLRRLDERRAARATELRARREAEAARAALERGRRRRRALLAAVAALALFGAAMTYQVSRTRQEAERANVEATAARQVADFLEGLFVVADPDAARGSTVTAREILERGAQRIEEDLAEQPELQARLMDVMGGVYRHLGLYDQAQYLIERGLELRRELYGAEHPAVAQSLNHLGRLLYELKDGNSPEPPLREALAQRRKLLDKDNPDLAETLCELANVLIAQGELEEAEVLGQECLAIRRRIYTEPNAEIAETLFTLAVLEHQRDPVKAEGLYRETLVMTESLYGESHPEVGEVLNNYGLLLRSRGDLAAAEPLYRRALEIQRRILPDGHPTIGVSATNLAFLLNAEGKHKEAEEMAREAETTFLDRFGTGHRYTALARAALGMSLTGQRRFDEAEPALVASYAALSEQLGDEGSSTQKALQRLVDLYTAWGKPQRAADYRARLATAVPE